MNPPKHCRPLLYQDYGGYGARSAGETAWSSRRVDNPACILHLSRLFQYFQIPPASSIQDRIYQNCSCFQPAVLLSCERAGPAGEKVSRYHFRGIYGL